MSDGEAGEPREEPPDERTHWWGLTEANAEAMRRITEQLSESVRASLADATSSLASIGEAIASTMPPFERVFESWAPVVEQFALQAERLHELWLRSMPANWVDLDDDQVLQAVERAKDTGVTLVWVPRSEIVREVLAVDAGSSMSVLFERRDDVLADAEACLADIDAPDLELMRAAIEDAIRALRDGNFRAAQALGAAVLASEIHEFFESPFGPLSRQIEERDHDDLGIEDLRLWSILFAVGRALARFDPITGQPVRSEFNRHNTAHRITAEQWTETNAFSAIMLTTALLREMAEG